MRVSQRPIKGYWPFPSIEYEGKVPPKDPFPNEKEEKVIERIRKVIIRELKVDIYSDLTLGDYTRRLVRSASRHGVKLY